MKVAGFSFNKISIEKFKNQSNDFKINTNMDISEIKSLKQDIFKLKEDFVEVKFVFTLNYTPEFAKIELVGNVILSIDPKLAREVLNQWKDRKLAEDFRISLFNIILRKSNLKALQLEEEMNLPIHLSLPVIRKEDIQQKEEIK
jgi:hypothetical protein